MKNNVTLLGQVVRVIGPLRLSCSESIVLHKHILKQQLKSFLMGLILIRRKLYYKLNAELRHDFHIFIYSSRVDTVLKK